MPNSRFICLISSLILTASAVADEGSKADKDGGDDRGRWHCQPKEDGSGWQCEQATPDENLGKLYQPVTLRPRSARTGLKDSKGKAVRASSQFAHLDWVPTAQLSPEQAADVPVQCSGAYVEPDYIAAELRTADPALQPIKASSKTSESTEDGVSTLTGDVVLSQGYRKVKGEKAIINREAGTAEFIGEMTYREPGMKLIGQDSQVNLETREVTVNNSQMIAHETHVRTKAEVIYRADDGVINIKKGELTQCEPGVNTWAVAGRKIKIDPVKEVATVKHATLKIRGVPVLYSPYARFPLGEKRESGFLIAELGESDDGGADIALPYYLNLAPNYDATISPRYIEDRGTGGEVEFRYLTENSRGQVGGAFLSDDDLFGGEDRWLTTLKHDGQLYGPIKARVDYNEVSDEEYFSDLGTELSVSSKVELLQLAEASYTGKYWGFILRGQGYQILDNLIAAENEPYDRLPQLLVNAHYPNTKGITLGVEAEYTDFDRDNTGLTGLDRAVGRRVRVEPAIGWSFDASYGYFRPQAKFKYIQYDLDDLSPGLDDNPDISVPVYSIDTGLIFERDMKWGDGLTQTFEPRLFYLKIPEEDQSNIPLFDTSEATFSYSQLFREDRFIGNDRVGDADQLSVGITSRILSDNGAERLRFSVGQIFYNSDREVTLTGAPGREEMTSESAYVAELLWRLSSGWKFGGDVEWDPDIRRTNHSSAYIRYRGDNSHIFNIGFRSRQDRQTLDQSDLSVIWPLSKRWRIIARWNQDLRENRIVEALAGLSYEGCCWSVRFVSRRYINDDNLLSPNQVDEKQAFYIQFQLKGLAGVGESLESVLTHSIPGYEDQRKAQ